MGQSLVVFIRWNVYNIIASSFSYRVLNVSNIPESYENTFLINIIHFGLEFKNDKILRSTCSQQMAVVIFVHDWNSSHIGII